jgi:hypothetical protein
LTHAIPAAWQVKVGCAPRGRSPLEMPSSWNVFCSLNGDMHRLQHIKNWVWPSRQKIWENRFGMRKRCIFLIVLCNGSNFGRSLLAYGKSEK